MNKQQRLELGNFLKSRRLRLTPQQVGLIAYGRRRTPGLRREEVAYLAGVSLTWYTWIEQGREVNFSPQIITGIIHALLLQPQEKSYVFELCGFQSNAEQYRLEIPVSITQFIDLQARLPVFVLGRYWDVLYMNQYAKSLFVGFTDLSEQNQNMLWYMFACHQVRNTLRDWEVHARRVVAEFRADYVSHLSDPWLDKFINRLRHESIEFNAIWDNHDVLLKKETAKVFNHPEFGNLAFIQHTFRWSENGDVKLVIMIPSQI
jgi:transcriptional regulator with XRE-family HTH domain